jgi:glutamate dehydrogenase/leucine dehydrogenase
LSREATGYGAYYVIREIVQKIAMPANAKVSLQGFGNVGRVVGELLQESGYRIIAVSDIFGGVYNANGIDIFKLGKHCDETGSVADYPGSSVVSTSGVLETECDILIPAAVQP